MYLKQLEIQGFKTFAQRTTFVFPPGITAIVGPNGSGKSNIIDSVRWVLGEQSFANLRCKRSEDLIFGGGRGRAPVGFADVALTIDNSDRLLPLPYDEVTIGRRAYRNGENEYYINRTRVRLRDVLDAVAPLGSSFTLINQGLVDAALALQPGDRQKLFEDAADIGPYQARKTEAERRLRETETNMVRLRDLLQEQEPHLKTLRRQANEAEAFGVVDAELRMLLARQYRLQGSGIRSALRQAEEISRQTTTAVQSGRGRVEEATGALAVARSAEREAREALAQQRELDADLNRKMAGNLRDRAVEDERRAGLQLRHDELLRREQSLRETCAQDQAELAELRARIERTKAERSVQRVALDARLETAADLLERRRIVETTLRQARAEQARFSTRLGMAEARQGQLSEHLRGYEREGEAIIADEERAKRALAEARSRTTTAEAAVSTADQEIRNADTALDQAHHAFRSAREARDASVEALATNRRRAADLQARYDSLHRIMSGLEGTFPGVRAAMQWAERSNLTGFRLVSSILVVPHELERAIEIALGSRLQQIVVDRWEDAEATIVELKRTRAGRATFLPLDTLRAPRTIRRPERALRRPGVRGCAADLVEFEQQYSSVAELLLGRTLIVEDLNTARAVLEDLEGGASVVTLAGEQVATSGALTGGADRSDTGTLRRMREYRELPEQIGILQQEILQGAEVQAQQERAISAAQAEVHAAERRLRDVRAARDHAQTALEGSRRDLHRAEDADTAVRRRSERLEQQREATVAQLQAGEADVAALRASTATAQAAAQHAELSLTEYEDAAREEEGTLRTLRDTLAQVEAEVRVQTEEHDRRSRTARAAEQELVAIEGRAAELAAGLVQGEAVLERLRRSEQELAEQARDVAAQLATTVSALEQHSIRVQELEVAERWATTAVLDSERAHADAMIELQRCRADYRSLAERATLEGIDLLSLEAEDEDATTLDDLAALESNIERLRSRLRRMGPVNALAPAEYLELAERHNFLAGQLGDVETTAATVRTAIDELDQIMDAQFQTTFEAVAEEFSAAFTHLFGGGSARLALVASDGEENQGTRRGVEILAQPPGKRQMHLQLLSGGERALTAAALLFAILKHHPRPFCVMDEVDAALDEANVVRFREVLLDLGTRTQFIVVTHNRGTVEVADTLYGVSMGEEGASHVLSLRFVEGTNELAEVSR